MADDKDLMIVVCPCGQNMAVPATAMGKHCKCVKCGERFPITKDNTRPYKKEPPQGAQTARETRAASQQESSAKASTPAMPDESSRPISERLLRRGLVTPRQLQEALAVQGKQRGSLVGILAGNGHLNTANMFAVFSKEMEPFDLTSYTVEEALVPLIPAEFVQEHCVFPLERIAKVLTVGMPYPLGADASADLQHAAGHQIKHVLCGFEELDALIRTYYVSESKPAPPPKEPAPATSSRAPAFPAAAPRSDAPPESFPRLEMLPPLSGTVQRVRTTADGTGNSIRDLAGIVSTDPAVAARLLSVANSSAYGLPDRVTNVNLAAILLGFRGTDAVVMAFENVPGLAETSSFNVKAFWLKSMFCAAASMSIAKISAHGQVADAYTVGVMHEIGRLAQAYLFPEKYAKVPPAVALAERLAIEEKLFGMTHPEAGYLLAVQWRLPAIVADPIRYHHHRHFTGEVEDLVAVVALASAMTEAFGQAGGPAAEPLADCEDLLALLEMDMETATRLYEKTCATLKVAAAHSG